MIEAVGRQEIEAGEDDGTRLDKPIMFMLDKLCGIGHEGDAVSVVVVFVIGDDIVQFCSRKRYCERLHRCRVGMND